MKLGTKSLLFGAHALWLHPFMVALAWWKLYGLPWHPYLWICFFIHDLGYWGLDDTDGPAGRRHPIGPAKWAYKWLGVDWGGLCMFHSRWVAEQYEYKPSALCWADKLATCLVPRWLYLPMVRATGELEHYKELAIESDVWDGEGGDKGWYEALTSNWRAAVEEAVA